MNIQYMIRKQFNILHWVLACKIIAAAEPKLQLHLAKKKKRKVESLFYLRRFPPAAVFGNLLFIPAWLLPNAAEASPHCCVFAGLLFPFWPVRLPPCSCAGSLRRVLMRQPSCVVAPVDKLSYRLTAFTAVSPSRL